MPGQQGPDRGGDRRPGIEQVERRPEQEMTVDGLSQPLAMLCDAEDYPPSNDPNQ